MANKRSLLPAVFGSVGMEWRRSACSSGAEGREPIPVCVRGEAAFPPLFPHALSHCKRWAPRSPPPCPALVPPAAGSGSFRWLAGHSRRCCIPAVLLAASAPQRSSCSAAVPQQAVDLLQDVGEALILGGAGGQGALRTGAAGWAHPVHSVLRSAPGCSKALCTAAGRSGVGRAELRERAVPTFSLSR